MIRHLSFLKRLGIRIAAVFLRLNFMTLRMEVSPRGQKFLANPPASTLFLIWHNRLAMALAAFSRYGKQIPLTGLASTSGDGAIMTEVMHIFNIQTVRGSSSRRAVEATRELITALAAGRNVVITPDGPRGPIYTVKEGTAKVARDHAQATYILAFNCKRVWQFKSWDKLMIPKPFAKMVMDVEKVEMPGDSDAAAILREKMLELNS